MFAFDVNIPVINFITPKHLQLICRARLAFSPEGSYLALGAGVYVCMCVRACVCEHEHVCVNFCVCTCE